MNLTFLCFKTNFKIKFTVISFDAVEMNTFYNLNTVFNLTSHLLNVNNTKGNTYTGILSVLASLYILLYLFMFIVYKKCLKYIAIGAELPT